MDDRCKMDVSPYLQYGQVQWDFLDIYLIPHQMFLNLVNMVVEHPAIKLTTIKKSYVIM